MESNLVELAVISGKTASGFTLTDTGAILKEDMTYDQWRDVLRLIKWCKTKLTIGLSDCIEFGENKWGKEKVSDALEQLEFDLPMVKSAMLIQSVPKELRYPNLTSDHYIELAKADIPKDKKISWAKVASDQCLTATQLRYSIPAGEVIDKSATKALSTGVITIHGIRQMFDVWFHQVGGIEGIEKMQPEVIEEIKGEIKSIADLWGNLNK